MLDIKITLSSQPKPKPSPENLGFGKYFSDHVFTARYSRSKGWYQAEILPYQNFQMDPAASVFHYGQALFEGMKAFKQSNGRTVLFRPEFNCKRLQAGAERLCMQAPPQDLVLDGVRKLVKVDESWIPTADGCSLYIRPTLIGTEAFLGVRPSDEYLFYVILSPVGSYYGSKFTPIPIWIETEDLRAAPGGLGATKAGANYAASLRAAVKAREKGFSQVLWLDAQHEAIEEVGTMNVFFLIKNQLVTPALNGSILAGNTRDAVISLAHEWGIPVQERKITLNELIEASKDGDLKDAFGTGTAAVITPVGRFESKDHKIQVGDSDKAIGPLAQRFYNEITGIQNGTVADIHHWIVPV